MFKKFKKQARINGKRSAHADAIGAVTKTKEIARIVFQLEFPQAVKPFADRLTNLEYAVNRNHAEVMAAIRELKESAGSSGAPQT